MVVIDEGNEKSDKGEKDKEYGEKIEREKVRNKELGSLNITDGECSSLGVMFSDSKKFNEEKKEEGNEVSKKDEDDDDLPLFEKIKMLKKEVYLVKVFLEQKKNQKLCPEMLAKLVSLKEGLLTRGVREKVPGEGLDTYVNESGQNLKNKKMRSIGKKETRKDIFDMKAPEAYDWDPRKSSSLINSLVNQLLKNLKITEEEKKNLNKEITFLKVEQASSKEENKQSIEEMRKEQVVANAHFDKLLENVHKQPFQSVNLVLLLSYPS
ncbi:uncharacterized protein [Nicotiana tomentosiformis]|uniref:uncharacterized protein n=1 Tax=Nicotiana tomentosiformis TaxID=4098 RepID=UPI00388CA7C7